MMLTSISTLFLFVVASLILSSCGENVPGLPKSLRVISNVKYPLVGEEGCNHLSEPCAKLNDIWGYEFLSDGEVRFFAVVGMATGIDIVDVTDPENPTRVSFIPGCIDNWRDMKVWGHMIYGISEYTMTCNCNGVGGEKCQEMLIVESPPEIEGLYKMTEGRLTVQLSQLGNITGNVVRVEPWDDAACDVILNADEINGNIALIPVGGDCQYSPKMMNAQEAGAIGVILQNVEDSFVYPGMTGWSSSGNLTIPGVMVSNITGEKISMQLSEGKQVVVTLSGDVKEVSDYYAPPEGLTIIDMSNPFEPTLHMRYLSDFNFAHNLFIEDDRPYLYTCGMSDRNPNQDGFGDLSNGGIFMYDITENQDPVLINLWNESYIHDLMVHQCEGSYILFGAGIRDDHIYVFNVTNPTNWTELTRFYGRQGSAHNVWVDKDCTAMYVTHERTHEVITVWSIWRDRHGNIDWTLQPKYRGSLSLNQFNGTLPHNVHVNDTILYASYYSEGVIAWNISDPLHPEMIAHEDTSEFTGGFFGVWGVYPFASNGFVYASDREEGLFVMRLEDGEPLCEDKSLHTTLAIAMGAAALFLLALVLILVIVIIMQKRSKGGYVEV